ncbi:MAG: hypothetical protein NT166_05630 [Candidatus Aminicenantes bacterium]|nr:hypothetical protein [Candidatus Aminicenantes bacterium]
MAAFKVLQGILALVDIVNFTNQSIKMGDTVTADYISYFQDKIKHIVEKHGFRIVNSQGDAVLFFGAEGIKVFRLERYALSWELVVTHPLYLGIKHLLTGESIEANRLELNEPLTGFDNEAWFPPFYRLRIVSGDAGVSNLLEQRMEELRRDVAYIPVFGNIYPPVPMEKNFINLSLAYDEDFFQAESSESLPGQKGNTKKNVPRQGKEIDVTLFYEKHRKGAVIFGLPGAGKITILRCLAFREFKGNESKLPGETQTVLFVSCYNAPFYDTWFKQRYASEPGSPSYEEALSYMTWVFLFGKKQVNELTPDELVEFRNAELKVVQSFKEKRLTLLVDALDEAQDLETRERIRQLFFVLHSENRLVLTSISSEKIYLAQGIRQYKIQVFEALSLNMEQVRSLARHILDEDSTTYKNFDAAVWQEEVVVKMTVTPIIALLIAAYYQAYEKFDLRFQMYEMLMKFILLKAWDNIKINAFPFKNLELFFMEVKKSDFFEKHREIKVLYDALAYLCFHLFYNSVDGKAHFTVDEETLIGLFIGFIKKNWPGAEEKTAPKRSEQWFEQLHKDHLLIQTFNREYVFSHSTIMEYIAACYLVEHRRRQDETFVPLLQKCLGNEDYLELETVPIACGSDMLTGFKILGILRDLKPSYPRLRLLAFGVKCLVELERLTEKTLQGIRIESLKEPILEMTRQNKDAMDWLYEYKEKRLKVG